MERTDHPTPPNTPTRGLLAAVLEALDIPAPATVGDEAAYHQVLADRARHVCVALASVLEDKPLMGIDWTADYLRERLAEHPPTGYVTAAQARATRAEGEAGR